MQDKVFIGVDIGGTNIIAGRLVNNILVKKVAKSTGAGRPKQMILETLYNAIREIWTNDVLGIGIGVPGFLDVKTGEILQINNIPSFSGLNLIKEVVRTFNVPVFINNDANCFVLGESCFGAGIKYNNIIGITLGTGLGGGILNEGSIISGIFGGAGEFGCIPYLDSNFENYCSGKFFNKYGTTGKELYPKAKTGDVFALNTFREFGKHLGNLIREIMYFIAPEVIIIGGSISKSYSYFNQAILDSFNNLPEKHYRNNINVIKAELTDAAILGAAALAINNISSLNRHIEHSA